MQQHRMLKKKDDDTKMDPRRRLIEDLIADISAGYTTNTLANVKAATTAYQESRHAPS